MLLRGYKVLQLLSIDVVLGACATSFLVAQVLGIILPLIIYISLGGSVWLTYTIDHLLDANTNTKEVVTPRHSFHKKYFKELIYIWLLVFMATGVFSLFYLPIQTIYFGIIAVALVIIHLVLVKLLGSKVSVYIQKELGIALTYSLGVLVGPLSLMSEFPNYLYLVVLQVFTLAFINLIEFSYFEVDADTKQGQTSLVHNIGKGNVSRLIRLLVCFGAVLNVISYLYFQEYYVLQLVLSVMYLVLLFILLKKDYFAQDERYRLWGDMVFIFPSILLML